MCVGEAASVCGEEYKKEGEEIVFFCCCRAEGEIYMRDAFGVLWLAPIIDQMHPTRSPEPAFRPPFSHLLNNP